MKNLLRKEKGKLFLLIILMICVLISGCSKQKPAAASSAAAPAVKEGEFLIRLGHSNSPDPDNIITYASTYFANRIEELTNKGIKVEIYPLNQTGNDGDQLTALQNGSQEMNYTAMTSIAPFCQPMYVYSLPYLLPNPDKVVPIIMALWDKNQDWLTKKAGLRLIGYAVAGYRQLSTSSKYKITDLASAKGMKIRIPPNAISEATFRKLGLEPVAMGVNEVFTSLQQGVVSAQENCLTFIRSEHLYEVQSYIIDINWQYNMGMFTMSEQFYQKLPQKYQEIVTQVGKEMTEKVIAKFSEMDTNDINYLKNPGKIEFLGKPADYDKWVEIGKSVWENSYSVIGGGDAQAGKAVVDEIISVINKY